MRLHTREIRLSLAALAVAAMSMVVYTTDLQPALARPNCDAPEGERPPACDQKPKPKPKPQPSPQAETTETVETVPGGGPVLRPCHMGQWLQACELTAPVHGKGHVLDVQWAKRPLRNLTGTVTVSWGDGAETQYWAADLPVQTSHTYANPGAHNLRIVWDGGQDLDAYWACWWSVPPPFNFTCLALLHQGVLDTVEFTVNVG